MNKEQQELSEGVEMFDPQKVERTKWVNYGYDGWAPWSDIPENDDICGVTRTIAASDYDRLLAIVTAKDALIASLKSEISKQNKAEDELLATGEKLAEERNSC